MIISSRSSFPLSPTPFIALLTVLLLAAVAGCDDDARDDAQTFASDTARSNDADATADADAIEFDPAETIESVADLDPEALLDEVIAAYREAPAMTDRLVMTYRTATMKLQKPFEGVIKVSGDGNALFATPRTTVRAVDGKVFVTLTSAGDRYLQTDLVDGDLKKTMRRSVRASGAMPHHFSMRSAQPEAAVLRDITLDMLNAPSVASADVLRNAFGEEVERLRITATDGSMDVFIDPATKLIIAADAEIPQPSDPSRRMTVNIRFNPRIMDQLDEPIAFSLDGMTRVESVQALADEDAVAGSADEGETAPSFTIPNVDGETVALDDLRGSYVVLDFWATWCKPCVKAFPHLDEFNDWADSSAIPIKVYGVNVMESAATTHDRIKRVDAFWDMQQLGFPTLIDTEGRVQNSYEIISIPVTLVIAPDGSVLRRFMGYDEQIADRLQRVINEHRSARPTSS